MTFEFILILGNIDETTNGLEDSLFEASCDDALINFRNGTVYLDFHREANSFEEAVISAIMDVESSKLDTVVIGVAPENLVSESEIAKRLKIKRQTVSLWIRGKRRINSNFPKPVMRLAEKSPLWKWSDVTKWLYQNHIIKDMEIVSNAMFIQNINAVLEERDKPIRKIRKELLKKLVA